MEDHLVEELLASDTSTSSVHRLLHADETTWLIAGKPFWLWVFVTTTVTLYSITFRTNELVRNLLGEFKGWLMPVLSLSKQATVIRFTAKLVLSPVLSLSKYCRSIANRLRCWAHTSTSSAHRLERKAKGLAESLDREAAAFGTCAELVEVKERLKRCTEPVEVCSKP